MALTQGLALPYGVQPVNPVPTDSWSGPYEGATETIAKAAANASIPSAVRFKSLEVRLIINGISRKFWYANGISDSDLVEFFSQAVADSKYLALTGGKINGNLTIFGDLSATGTSTFSNTIYSTTSALSVVNVGNTGPAVYVGNNGTGDLASFYDIDSNIEVFHIGGANGDFPNIGVKTSTPNKDLTVNGEISAYNNIWTSGQFISAGKEILSIIYPDIEKGLSVYTTISGNSGNYVTYDHVYSNYLNLTGGTVDGNVAILSSFEVGTGTTTLFVSGSRIGVNTESPTSELTVLGSISASNKIYGTIIDWMTLTRGYKIEPTLLGTTVEGSDSGDVYEYTYESFPSDVIYYRFISDNGTRDEYYESYSLGSLSNLLTRKQIIL